jgi:aspartate/methionine/tyrosine aminotransferase
VKLIPFSMERWQSTWEHRVRYNLSESGVHPMTAGELLALAEMDVPLGELRLGYGQSNGSDALRAKVAALHEGATDGSVLITTGGAEANFAVTWRLLELGGPVAAVLPNYMQVPGIVESLGGEVIPVGLVESDAWAPHLQQLAEALDGGARSILITQPNNPTGASLDERTVDEIVSLAREHEAWILADEVYRGAELGEWESPSFWGKYERVFVTGSLSKASGLPGLRVGWVVGPREEMEGLWARKDYTTIAPATLSDALANVALDPRVRPRVLARTREILTANLPVMEDWMASQGERFSCRPPDAGAICYVRYHADVNSTRLAEYLRTEKSTLVVPGDQFGMDHYLRIGFGPERHELEAALARVQEAFDELTAS